MRHYHVNTKEFVVGAVVGSLLGSVAALLVAPKSGKGLREDICDTYCNLSDKTHDLARKGRSFARNASCQTCDWASKARSAFDGARRYVKGWRATEEEEEQCTKDFLIGGIAGGILGAVVGLLMAPKSGEELRQDIRDTYEDVSDRTQDFANDLTKRGRSFAKTARKRANKWIDLAHHVVDDLTENAQDTSEDLFERAKGLFHDRRAQEVIDWASIGYRLWQGIKANR
jgi:gas vesicle protein